MRVFVTLPLLAAALLAAARLAAADDPRQWLMDMNDAFSELSYDGVFSYFSGSELTSLRVVHMVVDGELRERLIHLNGAPREIVRVGEEVICILEPGDDLLALEGSLPQGPFARAFVRNYDDISGFYDLRFGGEDRIAGRPAVRLSVAPMDADRFGYRLWLDRETRLLLRSDLVNAEGEKLEIFQFNTVAIGSEVDPRALEPTSDQDSEVTNLHLAAPASNSRPAGKVRWSAGWVPVGFRMESASTRTTLDEDKSIETMSYSDGLAAFSVFIESMPPAGAASMISRSGATVAVTHLATGSGSKPHLVTVVGELPTATAQKIAQSIRFQ